MIIKNSKLDLTKAQKKEIQKEVEKQIKDNTALAPDLEIETKDLKIVGTFQRNDLETHFFIESEKEVKKKAPTKKEPTKKEPTKK